MSERASVKTALSKPSVAAPSKAATRPALSLLHTHLLQRACACGAKGGSGAKCQPCKDEKDKLMQRASNGSARPTTVPPIVNQAINSPGHPIDAETRALMESRFGHDFSRVRIHNNSLAAESARAVNARAYTVGQHIAFDQGQYAPHTESGKHLLAHELAHTIQQQGIQRFSDGTISGESTEYTQLEHEASTTADTVMRGGTVSGPHLASGPLVQRAPWSAALPGGTCPQGTKISPFESPLKDPVTGLPPEDVKDVKVYTIAEEVMVEHYIQKHPGNIIVTGGIWTGKTGRALLENLDASKDPMLKALQGGFYSEKRSSKSKTNSDEDSEISTDYEDTESGFSNVSLSDEGKKPRNPAYLRPDIMDISTRRVFDVTTIGQAPNKKNKIETVYVSKLNEIKKEAGIGGKEWKAGSEDDLAPPSEKIILYRYQEGKFICYGSTDFAEYPGVISYIALDLSGRPPEASNTESYIIKKGEKQATLQIPKGAVKKSDIVDIPESDPASRMISGLALTKLERKTSGPDFIHAAIESKGDSKESTGLPIETQGKKEVIRFSVDKKTREMTQKKDKNTSIKFEYKPMSAGEITDISVSETTGLSGKGYIKPSIALLKGTTLNVEFSEDKMEVVSQIPKEKLKTLPGLTVTDVGLKFQLAPEFKPSGYITFYVGPKAKPFADGKIEVSADEQGFYARGNLATHIPGVDEAPLEVEYRKATGWSGSARITTSKIPYVKNASVIASLNDDGFDISGGLTIPIPGSKEVSLSVQKQKGETAWIYQGDGEFDVPGLKPVVFTFTYDGQKISGDATTGFTFKGLDGNITLNYEDGIVTGTGHVAISKPKSKPKVTGSITVKFSKKQKLSGEGKISYEIKPGLIATGGIKIDEDGKVTLTGMLTFPNYKLFDKFPDKAKPITIFELPTISIPIPGASIGTVGLKAQIKAGIYAGYSVGPGEIRGGYIKTVMNPLEDNPNIDIELGGQVYIPASFSVTGKVSGAIALDILIASVSGGLVVAATASLEGHVLSNLKAHYSKDEFEAEADFKLILDLILSLALKAFVEASALGWHKTKEWDLASFRFDSGMKLGLELTNPLRYSSKTGFTAPSLSDITWVLPKFEPEKAVKESFSRNSGTEKEK